MQKSEKKVNYEIRKAKKKFPNKKIVLTGCENSNVFCVVDRFIR